jgi:copper oxidase (laccase) domain-containing protein
MLQVMRDRFRSHAGKMRIAIGPAIRFCCYEVGPEFREYFPRHYRLPETERGALKAHVDLIGAVCSELIAEGVSGGNIYDSGICTSCQNHRFFSVRKGDGVERICSVIQID